MAHKDIETNALPEMMGNFHKIPCVPYGAPGTKYILTMAEPFLADGYRIVLLGNNGSLAVGKTVEDAMNVVEACEAIAEQILITNYILYRTNEYLKRQSYQFLSYTFRRGWLIAFCILRFVAFSCWIAAFKSCSALSRLIFS